MKLQRLAGYGPTAAFASAGSVLVFLVEQEAGSAIVGAAPPLFVALAIAFVLALFAWVASLAIVTFDLGWLEHPATSTVAIRIAQVAALVALVMTVLVGIAPFTAGVNLQAPSFLLLFVGVAINLLIHNFEGRRAGLLHGVLPWLGIVDGIVFVIAGLGYGGFLIPSIGMTVFIVGFNFAILGFVLYIVWAVWMGVKLTRSKSVTSGVPSPTTS